MEDSQNITDEENYQHARALFYERRYDECIGAAEENLGVSNISLMHFVSNTVLVALSSDTWEQIERQHILAEHIYITVTERCPPPAVALAAIGQALAALRGVELEDEDSALGQIVAQVARRNDDALLIGDGLGRWEAFANEIDIVAMQYQQDQDQDRDIDDVEEEDDNDNSDSPSEGQLSDDQLEKLEMLSTPMTLSLRFKDT
ncbi:hypothetical protein EJ08DRAFT_661342 [Tothia fuscella]|uniref:Uncharacterized protein n=1 Tax=Tothia fuscella TaxID=1048955 RepID=A0A9P4NQK3_9PEZI|nr:hypothetical protein EJ08DRAFT_661342 [Tothia fuscella]